MNTESNHPLITDVIAVCTTEPRGDHGLEGYQRGESYRAQSVKLPGHPMFYRVYPGSQDSPDYFESAIPRVIARFFRIEEKS